ncbi:hypothetical protein D1641_13875 [Colidextribacter sp. OB.20]|uniref:hypothetical protein n=1 Tax=Colidextribacter sp. OB.20 TaxID=2304568 RepID=UPI00136F7B16|nr:hypothetical protein [Colidextribacter sp. OB.20]NBI11089.1 hypothetical protein [Colidextribacter sp. OB.20]
MKKFLLTAVIASMLIVPLGNTALAGHEEAPAPVQVQEFLPGDVPAETGAAETMLPAVHGLVLALLNHDARVLDLSDGTLAWEGLYNMLSLYGQLDSRTSSDNGELFLPEETVRDYAAALELDVDSLPPLPAELRDRINYDNVSRCYVLFRGEDDQARLQLDSAVSGQSGLVLTGALIYEVDGQVLTRFQATLQPQDSMFGFSIRALTITG